MAIIRITGSNGNLEFDTADLPLMSRSISNGRNVLEGHSVRTINLRIAGYFRGSNHSAVMNKMQLLIKALRSEVVDLYYHDGSEVIFNRQVYVNGYNEPQEWKQYDGSFDISFTYVEHIDRILADTEIQASFSSSNGNFEFNPVPSWSSSKVIKRIAPFRSRTTSSGFDFGRERKITLSGHLEGVSAADTQGKIEYLKSVFSEDGTLVYGSFARSVKVNSINVPNTFPRSIAPYKIELSFFDGELISLSSSRRLSRIHYHPKIKNLPYCGKRIVKTYNASGQIASFNVKVQAVTISQAWNIAVSELEHMGAGGGIEMPGGSEEEDENNGTVTIRFTRYFDRPIRGNAI